MTKQKPDSEKELMMQLQEAIRNYDEDTSKMLTYSALKRGLQPLEVLDRGVTPVLRSMGEAFERGEIYLIELMAVSKAVEATMEILRPALEEREQQPDYLGSVVIGTIEGDIHDIGKNIVASLLQAAGFKVTDLGKDVPIQKFVETARDENIDILGVSALLTTTMQKQRELIKILRDTGMRDKISVMIGGAPSSEKWAQDIGADGYAPDATEAVTLAKRLMHSSRITEKSESGGE